jgi:kynurenine 3-monooxygenase
MMHDKQGVQTYQPYGKDGQFINSVSRGELNKVLMSAAERHGVEIIFNAKCTDINVDSASATFELPDGQIIKADADVLFGADGAFSAVRSRLQQRDRFNYSQSYIDHGYKELHIPADESGAFQLEKNVLHIWPRRNFMMIGLPNPDGSFTLTLFFAHNGSPSFQELKTREDVASFFDQEFPNAVPLMPSR